MDIEKEYSSVYKDSSNNYFADMTVKETFNYIYEKYLWGKDASKFYSGIGSHSPDTIKQFVRDFKLALSLTNSKNVVDLGCGDFNIGSHIVGLVESYIGVDVSDTIVQYNIERHPDIKFVLSDIADYKIPPGTDIVIIREVLQHLSNDHIAKILKNITNTRYLLVSEVEPTDKFESNKDIISGVNTRLLQNSAVVIDDSPFNFNYKERLTLSCIQQSNLNVITTALYVL